MDTVDMDVTSSMYMHVLCTQDWKLKVYWVQMSLIMSEQAPPLEPPRREPCKVLYPLAVGAPELPLPPLHWVTAPELMP